MATNIILKMGIDEYEENIKYPNFDIYYQVDDELYSAQDYVVNNLQNLDNISDEFKKTMEISSRLFKYINGNIVGEYFKIEGIDNVFLSKIAISFDQVQYEPIEKTCYDFSELVAKIYYDFNGRRIGFNNNSDDVLVIVQEKKIIDMPDKRDTEENREKLSAIFLIGLTYFIDIDVDDEVLNDDSDVIDNKNATTENWSNDEIKTSNYRKGITRLRKIKR